MAALHILVANTKNDRDWLITAAKRGNRGPWRVPKSAERGDDAVIYVGTELLLTAQITRRAARVGRRPRNSFPGCQNFSSCGTARFGDALKAQGKLDEALKTYRDSLTIREQLVAAFLKRHDSDIFQAEQFQYFRRESHGVQKRQHILERPQAAGELRYWGVRLSH